jgi:hypothetical protein
MTGDAPVAFKDGLGDWVAVTSPPALTPLLTLVGGPPTSPGEYVIGGTGPRGPQGEPTRAIPYRGVDLADSSRSGAW